MSLSIFTKKEQEKYKNNLDDFNVDNIDWIKIKSLLQIEGIDKAKVLKMSLNYLESIFRRKREVIMVRYVLEDGSSAYIDEEINNADEVLKFSREFLDLEEISEEDKIILKGVILRNFNNIINNSYYTMKTLEDLMSLGISKEEVLTNKTTILNNINNINVPEFNTFCIKNNEPTDLNLDQLVELMFMDKENIMPKNLEDLPEAQRKDYEVALYGIKSIISDLLQRQGKDLTEIAYLDAGAYSQAIRVGEFVLKIGGRRENHGVPYSKHIIRPLVSFRLKMGVNVEVQNLVDAKWWEIKDSEGNVIRELSEEEIEEELFKVWAQLKKDGIEWKDIKKENVGRLLKRNTSNLNIEYLDKNNNKFEEEYDQSDERLEIVGRELGENEVLPAGELVILDRDYLVGRGAWTAKNPTPKKGEEFNKRYEAMDR